MTTTEIDVGDVLSACSFSVLGSPRLHYRDISVTACFAHLQKRLQYVILRVYERDLTDCLSVVRILSELLLVRLHPSDSLCSLLFSRRCLSNFPVVTAVYLSSMLTACTACRTNAVTVAVPSIHVYSSICTPRLNGSSSSSALQTCHTHTELFNVLSTQDISNAEE